MCALAAAAVVGGVGCGNEDRRRPVGLGGHIVAGDFRFEPDDLTVQVGQQTSILLENEDNVTHNFRLPSLGIDRDVEAHESTRIDFTIGAVPDVLAERFECRFHGFEGMKGTVHILP